MTIYTLEPSLERGDICFVTEGKHIPTGLFFAHSERDIVDTVRELSRRPEYQHSVEQGYYPFNRMSSSEGYDIEEVDKARLRISCIGAMKIGNVAAVDLTDSFTLELQREGINQFLLWRKEGGAEKVGPLYGIDHNCDAGWGMRSFVPLDVLSVMLSYDFSSLEREAISAWQDVRRTIQQGNKK